MAEFDSKVTLAWLDEVFTEAAAEAKAGKFGKLNGLTKSPALSFYYINVHKIKTIKPEQFALQYTSYIDEAEQIRQQVVALDESAQQNERLTQLENKVTAELEKLPGLIREALAEIMAEKPAKKGKSAKTEPETDHTEADAESEA